MSGKAKKRERAVEAWGPWEARPQAVADAQAGLHGSELTTMIAAHLNRVLSVQAFDFTPSPLGALRGLRMVHLIIRRHDGSEHVTWQDKQRIKDELVGPEWRAFEVFPPRSSVVDERNLYHLWCMEPALGVFLVQGGARRMA